MPYLSVVRVTDGGMAVIGGRREVKSIKQATEQQQQWA